MSEVNIDDPRWEGNVPWFLRHSEFEAQEDLFRFFELTASRVTQFFLYDVVLFKDRSMNHEDKRHLVAQVKNQSFSLFSYHEDNKTKDVMDYLPNFFTPQAMKGTALNKLKKSNPHRRKWVSAGSGSIIEGISKEQYIENNLPQFFPEVLKERLFVLEVFLRVVNKKDIKDSSFSSLRTDLRGYLAISKVMLDIRENPILITPIDEPLLQKEVVEELLPRLQLKFPQEGHNLIEAYHQLLTESDTNKIFGNAFKALEVIARSISGNPSLLLSDKAQVTKAFPGLHPTTIKSVVNLAAHRGDEGGHGGKAPPINQMRYLLLHVCNVALLLLETRDAT